MYKPNPIQFLRCHSFLPILLVISISGCASSSHKRVTEFTNSYQPTELSQNPIYNESYVQSDYPYELSYFPSYYQPTDSFLFPDREPWWINYNYFVDTWPETGYRRSIYNPLYGPYEDILIWEPYPSYRFYPHWFGMYLYYWDLWPGWYPYNIYGPPVVYQVYQYHQIGGDYVITATWWDYPGWGYPGWGYPWWGYSEWDWPYYPYPRQHWVPPLITHDGRRIIGDDPWRLENRRSRPFISARKLEPQLNLRTNSPVNSRSDENAVSPRRDGTAKSWGNYSPNRSGRAISPHLPSYNSFRNPQPSLNIRSEGFRRSSFLNNLEPAERDEEFLSNRRSLLDAPSLNPSPPRLTDDLPFTITVPSGPDYSSARSTHFESDRSSFSSSSQLDISPPRSSMQPQIPSVANSPTR